MEFPARNSRNWRLLLWLVLLVAGAWVVLHRLADARELARTMAGARFGPLALAVVLQVGTLINQPALYQSLYALVDLPTRWRDLAPLVWTGHFLNVATPSAGLGGTALLVEDARRHGWDGSRVTLANTLYFVLNFVWFAILLGIGLVLLWRWHDLKPFEISAALALFCGLALALLFLVALALSPAVMGRPLGFVAKCLNAVSGWFLRRDVWPEAEARKFANDFSSALGTLRGARGRLARPIGHAILVDSLEIAVLAACFAAFPGPGTATLALVVVGYAIGTLFLVVSVTPQGLGVVEGVMTATFVSLGIPLERAAVVVLAYRGLSFWLPLLAGFAASKSALAPGETRD